MSIRYLNPVSDRADWLAARTHGLGGSDAGVILGWDSYKNVNQLWEEKLGLRKVNLDGNHYVYWGSMLEDRVAQAYAHKKGLRVLGRDAWGRPCIFNPEEERPPTYLPDHSEYIPLLNPLTSNKYPWMRSNVDGYALNAAGDVITGLEFKTGGDRSKRDWSWLAPPKYVAQVWHNTVVAHETIGRSVPWELVALLGGNHFGIVKVPYDLSLVKQLVARERDLWRCVQSKNPPELRDYSSINWPFARNQDGETEQMAIPIQAPHNRVRILAPKGVHRAVVCDVVDRGEVESTWQGKTSTKNKISVHFLLTHKIPEEWKHPFTGDMVDCAAVGMAGRQFGLQQWYTASLDPRASYRKMHEGLLEREMTREEMDSHDAETLIGRQVQLVIKHKKGEKDGEDVYYANIAEILPADDDAGAVTIDPSYVRFEDREKNDESDSKPAEKEEEKKPSPAAEQDEDELPF